MEKTESSSKSVSKEGLFEKHPLIAILLIFCVLISIFGIFVFGGVLYNYGVFSPPKIDDEMIGNKAGFSKVDVDTWGVIHTSSNKFNLIFKNDAGKEVRITQVTIKGETEKTTPLNVVLTDGERSKNWTYVNCPEIKSGESYRWNVVINYHHTEYGEEPSFSSSGVLAGVAR